MSTPDARECVHRAGVERVVNLHLLQEDGAAVVDPAGGEADREGGPGLDGRAGGADADEAREHAVHDGAKIDQAAQDAAGPHDAAVAQQEDSAS